jgi:hypothetical protein
MLSRTSAVPTYQIRSHTFSDTKQINRSNAKIYSNFTNSSRYAALPPELKEGTLIRKPGMNPLQEGAYTTSNEKVKKVL